MSKENRNIIENLFKITKEKPYVFHGNIVDYDYIEVAKGLPEFFIVTQKGIFSWNMIKEFLELELKYIFNYQKKEEISFTEFYYRFTDTFLRKFETDFPDLDATDFGITQAEYDNRKYELSIQESLEIIYENPYRSDEYGVFTYPMIPLSELIEFLFYRIDLYSLKDYEFKHDKIKLAKRNEYPLYYGIFAALFRAPNNVLNAKELIHILSIDDINYLTPKGRNTIEFEDVRTEINKVKKYFKFSFLYDENDNISLTDFLDPIIQHFETNRLSYSEIESIPHQSGLVALIYNGAEFPLKNASEFVKLRNIIRIHSSEDIAKDYENFGQYKSMDDSILSAIINEEIDLLDSNNRLKNYNKWIRENILISYYPMDYSESNFYKFCLNLKFSPILELDPIYDNIFSKDILAIQEQFKKKLEIGNE